MAKLVRIAVHAFCPKCLTHVTMRQAKPKADPLLLLCESCGKQQRANTADVIRVLKGSK